MSHNASPALDARVERLREIAHADPRIEGVLLYGSWTLGEADAHSDIEAYLYLREDDLPAFDGPAFLAALGPLELAHTNIHGILAVVFDDLMRGEFHLSPAGAGIDEIDTWAGLVHLPDPDRAVLLDRTGRLTAVARGLATFRPPEPGPTAQHLVDELANWTLMVAHVLDRGENARAHSALHTTVSPLQLRLCRLLRGSTAHWLTPSRALEADLAAADRDRHARTLGPDIRAAARNSWRWSRELAAEASRRWGTRVPERLHERISEMVAG
ncbi:nucleotidyltransferase domain-containing protein [Actinokineospora sp. G85]|uniref:nucleotidyltransferase domain-containing protein n=1 Tax=Actinokineospora sp. G85 TaxID=3406626 RepID=UPI003C7615A5